MDAHRFDVASLLPAGTDRRVVVEARHAASGKSVDYAITVKRLNGTDTAIRQLDAPGGIVSPFFEPSLLSYEACEALLVVCVCLGEEVFIGRGFRGSSVAGPHSLIRRRVARTWALRARGFGRHPFFRSRACPRSLFFGGPDPIRRIGSEPPCSTPRPRSAPGDLSG